MNPWRKYLIGEFTWKRLLKSLLSIYLMLMTFALLFGDRLIFPVPSPNYTSSLENLGFLSSSDSEAERIAFCYLAGRPAMPTILWSHGNGEDIGTIQPLMKQLNTLGYSVMSYDYPGYGLSSGTPDEAGCYAAIDRAYHHLTTTLKTAPNQIIIVGQSIGSGPSCYLVEKQPDIAGLILISPFTSIYRVAFGASIFPGDRFNNLARIRNISQPVSILHGELDEMIPITHGNRLAAEHNGETTFQQLQNKGHNNIIGIYPDERLEFINWLNDSIRRSLRESGEGSTSTLEDRKH